MPPTIVLLPGMDGTGRLFRWVSESLRRRHPVVVLYPADRCLTFSELLRVIEAAVPQLHAELIDGPHLLLQRRPAECVNAIEKFLAG